MRMDDTDFDGDDGYRGPTDEELDEIESLNSHSLDEDMTFSSSSDKLDEILEKNEELIKINEELSKKLDTLIKTIDAIRRK